jgi:hypothetical protein
VREQQAAAREAERQRAEAAASSARAAEEANFMHGDPDCLVLDRRSVGTDSDDYVGYVTGTVKNTCDRSFDYVQVEINFYHPDGSLEDSGLANVNNLQSGDSWHFKTISQGSGGGTWRVERSPECRYLREFCGEKLTWCRKCSIISVESAENWRQPR